MTIKLKTPSIGTKYMIFSFIVKSSSVTNNYLISLLTVQCGIHMPLIFVKQKPFGLLAQNNPRNSDITILSVNVGNMGWIPTKKFASRDGKLMHRHPFQDSSSTKKLFRFPFFWPKSEIGEMMS